MLSIAGCSLELLSYFITYICQLEMVFEERSTGFKDVMYNFQDVRLQTHCFLVTRPTYPSVYQVAVIKNSVS